MLKLRMRWAAVAVAGVMAASMAAAAPNFAWANTATGSTADGGDIFTSVGADAAGNVYAVGTFLNGVFPNDFADIVIAKYNSAGVLQWLRTYNGAAGFDDVAYDAKVDSAGNVYVCGYTALDDQSANTDVLLLKVTSANVLQYATRVIPTSNDVDEYSYSVAFDGSGNVYVAGEIGAAPIGGGLPYNAALYRFNNAGVLQWSRSIGGTNGDYDALYEVRLASNGDAVACGVITNASVDSLAVRVSSANVLVFQDSYSTTGSPISENWALGIDLDSSGNAYVCGNTYKDSNPNDRQESFLRKYSPTGSVLFTSIYDGNASGVTTAEDVAVTGAGEAFVVGATTVGGVASSNFNQYIRKVSAGGSQLAVTPRDAGFEDQFFAVGLLPNGNPVAAGYSALDGNPIPSNVDGVVAEFSGGSLALIAAATYNGAGNDWDRFFALAVSGSNILVAGHTYATFSDSNALVAKYTTVSIVFPTSYLVVTGSELGGTLSSLFNSDDDKLFILCDEFNPNSNVEFLATSPTAAPSSLKLLCETSSTRNDLSMRTEMFNYVTNAWVQLDNRLSTVSDTSYTATATGTLSQYIGPSNALRSRHRSIPTADIIAFDGWAVGIDRWNWEVQ